MKAKALRDNDQLYLIHVQAWASQQVKATKGKGNNIKPYYRKFSDFFDYQGNRDRILNGDMTTKKPSKHTKEIAKLISQINKKGG